jgi:hypothetical protein
MDHDVVNGWIGRWISRLSYGTEGLETTIVFSLTRASGGTALAVNVDIGTPDLMAGDGYAIPFPVEPGMTVEMPVPGSTTVGWAAGVRLGADMTYVAVFSAPYSPPPAPPTAPSAAQAS